MDSFSAIGSLGDAALLVGLSSTRIGVAFLLLPVFSPEVVPAMVRNAVFMSLGVLVLALQPAVAVDTWTTLQWVGLFTKEALLGTALGFGLAAFLWAFTAAGQLVDTKVGSCNIQLTDPMSGQQASVSGIFLGRMASCMFMVSGGFMLFVGVLLDSFRLWPLTLMLLAPKIGGVVLFEMHLSSLMSLAFLVAAPALVVMFTVDLVLGLVNRYAPQLNLMAVSSSIKGLASTTVWLLMLGTLAQGFGDAMTDRIGSILPSLSRILVLPH